MQDLEKKQQALKKWGETGEKRRRMFSAIINASALQQKSHKPQNEIVNVNAREAGGGGGGCQPALCRLCVGNKLGHHWMSSPAGRISNKRSFDRQADSGFRDVISSLTTKRLWCRPCRSAVVLFSSGLLWPENLDRMPKKAQRQILRLDCWMTSVLSGDNPWICCFLGWWSL